MEQKTIIERYRSACMGLPSDIQAAEAEGRREKILSLTVTGGALAGSDSCDVTTVSVRAVGADGRGGFAYTQNLEEEPQAVIRQAAAGGALLDRAQAGKEPFLFARAETEAPPSGVEARPGENLPSGEKELPAAREACSAGTVSSVADGIRIGAMVERWALAGSELITQATVTTAFYETENWIVNSTGLCRESTHGWLDVSVSVVLQKDGAVYNASWYGSFEDERQLLEQKDELAKSLRRSQAAKAAAVPFDSGVYRVLLSRESMCNILITLWQAFSGCHQQREDSFLTGRMGEKAASGLLSICDAPRAPGCGYGRVLDSEGVRAGKNRLLTDGVVTGRLHNLASAAYFKEAPTGNAGRAEGFFSGLPTGVTAIPNVTYICPGQMREDEMLSCLGDGVWITETYDPFHSIQIGNGEFAIPCNGVRVIDGKPVGALNSLTITGNLSSLLQEVDGVGDTMTFRRFYTGLYYLGSPDLLVSRLQVNG